MNSVHMLASCHRQVSQRIKLAIFKQFMYHIKGFINTEISRCSFLAKSCILKMAFHYSIKKENLIVELHQVQCLLGRKTTTTGL